MRRYYAFLYTKSLDASTWHPLSMCSKFPAVFPHILHLSYCKVLTPYPPPPLPPSHLVMFSSLAFVHLIRVNVNPSADTAKVLIALCWCSKVLFHHISDEWLYVVDEGLQIFLVITNKLKIIHAREVC